MTTSYDRESKSKELDEESQTAPPDPAATLRQDSRKWVDYAAYKAKMAFGQRKERLAEELGDVAVAMRDGAAHLGQGERISAQYVEDGAERVERWKKSLEQHEADDFVEEASSFARQHPGVFLLGSALAGFSLIRVLRSIDYRQIDVLDTQEKSTQKSPPAPTEGTPERP